jgi:hypothetical protein
MEDDGLVKLGRWGALHSRSASKKGFTVCGRKVPPAEHLHERNGRESRCAECRRVEDAGFNFRDDYMTARALEGPLSTRRHKKGSADG